METATLITPFQPDATPVASAMACWRAFEDARELDSVIALAGRSAG